MDDEGKIHMFRENGESDLKSQITDNWISELNITFVNAKPCMMRASEQALASYKPTGKEEKEMTVSVHARGPESAKENIVVYP